MTIVDLGMMSIDTGALPVSYTPFPYNERRAYGIIAAMTSPDFNQVFSYLRVSFFVAPDNSPSFILSETQDIEIISDNQLLYFAASRLFGDNGQVTVRAQRLPRWRGAGDARPMTLQFLYDDQVQVPSWRD